MPKEKEIIKDRINRFVSIFGSDVFKVKGKILLCIPCEKGICADRKSQVVQHMSSQSHVKNLKKKKTTELFLDGSVEQAEKCKFTIKGCEFTGKNCEFTTKKCQFTMDLCEAFVSSNIPLNKINNPAMKYFLEKYIEKSIPSQSILLNYLRDMYGTTLSTIKQALFGKKIWISIDETSDIVGHKIANVIVGSLHAEDGMNQNMFFLNCVELEVANQHTVARLFDESVNILAPDYIKKEDVLLFVSDAEPYMIAAAKGIKILYPNLLHITCLAHGIHRIAEHIRLLFPEVDKFISNCTKIFIKAPNKIRLFQHHANGVPLPPPQPILTRWTTWIKAVIYYDMHSNLIHEVFDVLEESESSMVAICKKLMLDPKLFREIGFIAANYGFLCDIISKLETRNMALTDALNLIEETKTILDSVPGVQGNAVKETFDMVLTKNPGYYQIRNIGRVLHGEIDTDMSISVKYIKYFKLAQIISVDTERSFPIFKNVLLDNRTNLTIENLKYHAVVYCNNVFKSK